MKLKWAILAVFVLGFLGLFISSVLKVINRFEHSYKATIDIEVQTPLILVTDLLKNESYSVNLCSDTLVILHYWATWCKPCIEDFKTFETFYQRHREFANFLVISDESNEKVLAFIKRKNYKLPFTSLDISTKPFSSDVELYPSTYFIKNCKIERFITGKINWGNFNFDKLAIE